jgi:hypothetical protein
MSEEKSNKHNVIVRLLSEDPITYSSATFALAKSIDIDKLEDERLIIIGYDFNDSDQEETKTTKSKKPAGEKTELSKKISAFLSRSPGALGDLYAQHGWKGLYIGAAAGILVLILLQKWAVRLFTGNWA